MITIPPKAKELVSSVVWFDEDGILYSVAKADAPLNQTEAEIKAEMDKLREFTGGKKVCVISESNSRSAAPPKSQRDFIAAELNTVIKAFAIVSDSPLNRMIANLFFSFKPPAYPFKMFSNEQEARIWIKQYL